MLVIVHSEVLDGLLGLGDKIFPEIVQHCEYVCKQPNKGSNEESKASKTIDLKVKARGILNS